MQHQLSELVDWRFCFWNCKLFMYYIEKMKFSFSLSRVRARARLRARVRVRVGVRASRTRLVIFLISNFHTISPVSPNWVISRVRASWMRVVISLISNFRYKQFPL